MQSAGAVETDPATARAESHQPATPAVPPNLKRNSELLGAFCALELKVTHDASRRKCPPSAAEEDVIIRSSEFAEQDRQDMEGRENDIVKLTQTTQQQYREMYERALSTFEDARSETDGVAMKNFFVAVSQAKRSLSDAFEQQTQVIWHTYWTKRLLTYERLRTQKEAIELHAKKQAEQMRQQQQLTLKLQKEQEAATLTHQNILHAEP